MIRRFLLTGIAVFIASALDIGIHADGTKALVVAALVLALLNTFLTPLMMLVAAPLIVVTLGLFLIVPPAISVLITANVVPGFVVDGFWPAALLTLILFAVNWAFGARASAKVTVTRS